MAMGKGEQGCLSQVTEAIYWKGCQIVQIMCFIFRLTQYRENPTMPCESHTSSDTTTVVQLLSGAGPGFAKGTKLSKPVTVAMVSIFKEHQEVIDLCDIALTEQYYLFLIKFNNPIFRWQKYNSLGFIIRGTWMIKYWIQLLFFVCHHNNRLKPLPSLSMFLHKSMTSNL